MRNPGKLVIVAIFAVALVATAVSLWHHRESGRRALAFWGPDAAVLIAQAPQIDAIELRPVDPGVTKPADAAGPASERPIQRLGVGGRFYQVTAAEDASQAHGISNIRRALVLDATYQWDDGQSADKPIWQYALEFGDAPRSVIVLFDFDSGQASSTTSKATVRLDTAARSDWRTFFQEQFGRPPADAPAK